MVFCFSLCSISKCTSVVSVRFVCARPVASTVPPDTVISRRVLRWVPRMLGLHYHCCKHWLSLGSKAGPVHEFSRVWLDLTPIQLVPNQAEVAELACFKLSANNSNWYFGYFSITTQLQYPGDTVRWLTVLWSARTGKSQHTANANSSPLISHDFQSWACLNMS